MYKDSTKSTWGPWSKMFAPVNADTLSAASDPKIDNYITILSITVAMTNYI